MFPSLPTWEFSEGKARHAAIDAENGSRCDPKSDQESTSARPWGVGWWAGTHGEFLEFLSFDSHDGD